MRDEDKRKKLVISQEKKWDSKNGTDNAVPNALTPMGD